MKAYLIDSTARTVTAVTWDGKLPQMYALIGCDLVEARRLPQRAGEQGQDALFIDEEGMMNHPRAFFCFDGVPYPIAGNGLLIGPEHPLSGKQYDPHRTLEEVRARVRFLTPPEAVEMWNRQRAADVQTMREMRAAGVDIIDGGFMLELDDDEEGAART